MTHVSSKNFCCSSRKSSVQYFRKLCCFQQYVRRSSKPVGTRPGLMYATSTVLGDSVNNCPPFQSILLEINSPTSRLGIFIKSFTKYFETALQNRQQQDFMEHLLAQCSSTIAKFIFLERKMDTRLCLQSMLKFQ